MADHLLTPDQIIDERFIVTVTRKATVVVPERLSHYVDRDKRGPNEDSYDYSETTKRSDVERIVFSATVSAQPSLSKLAALIDPNG